MIRALPLVLVVVMASCGLPVGTAPFLAAEVTVLRAGDTVVAWRPTAADDSWAPPASAAYLGARWWALATDVDATVPAATMPPFPHGDVVAASAADLDGDGTPEVVVSYRHPARVVAWDPRPLPTDSLGRSAHLGVLRGDGTPLWLARRVPHPVGAVAACGRHIALAYTGFDTAAVVATTAATWNGFGFTVAPELARRGRIGCADVDADGELDPIVIGR